MAPPLLMLSILRRRVVDNFRGIITAFEAPNYPGQSHGLLPALALDVGVTSTAEDQAASAASTSTASDRVWPLSVLNDIIGNGFIWAVQNQRRSLERRHTRLRCPEKMHKVRTNLLMCLHCGNFHEAHTICGHCYEKIREETKAMQEAIAAEWNNAAVDKEVAVVYDSEADRTDEDKSGEFWQGKRIVEMKKPRPEWFHPNLKVKTRTPPAAEDVAGSRSSTSIVPHIK